MTRELKVKIKTLTPLWTGGAEAGKMYSLHETGIMGSLRWWHEAIVRGLGGTACNPAEHQCPDKDGHFCDACYLFGATGRKRAFRIDWDKAVNNDSQKCLQINVNNNRGWFLNRGLIREFKGNFFATRYDPIISYDETLNIVALILKLQSEWGGIGAKCQQGYGVTKILEMTPNLDIDLAVSAINKIIKRVNRPPKGLSDNLPNLNGFFFLKVQFDSPPKDDLKSFIHKRTSFITNNELLWYLSKANNGYEDILPTAPIVRYHLRKLIRQNITYKGHANAPARWKLMGILNGLYHREDFGKLKQTDSFWCCPECKEQWIDKPDIQSHRKKCKGRPDRGYKCLSCDRNIVCDSQHLGKIERQASNIHVSHAYRVDKGHFEFRIWGWIPSELPGDISRDDILASLKKWFGCNNESPKKTGFYRAKNGELWNSNNLNIKSLNPRIAYMEKDQEEKGEDFISRLISEENEQ